MEQDVWQTKWVSLWWNLSVQETNMVRVDICTATLELPSHDNIGR